MPNIKKPVVLCILDGFGITSKSKTNAISVAKTPFFNSLINTFPTVNLDAAGLCVGLPWGEVGNSEVGHMNIGSGVVQYQNLPRIDRAIEDGSLKKNQVLIHNLEKIKKLKGNIHVMGLLGTGGVHSHQRHLEYLLEILKKKGFKKNVYLHLFLDGRDSGKDSAKSYLKKLLKNKKCGQVASLIGRRFAMDRNNNWDRVEKAYNLLAKGIATNKGTDPEKLIDESYKNNIFDEQFEPALIVDKNGNPLVTVSDNDLVIFFNYRGDRARELSKSFVQEDFSKFETKKIKNLSFVTFTEYEKGLTTEVLFEPELIQNPLSKIISESGLNQLHIAETEKYAHVTFFINGLKENKFKGENRILIPSPAVPTYDLKPEMSAYEVTKEIENNISNYDFIIVNYANPDMVGHTGNLNATVKAVEAIDNVLHKLVKKTLALNGSLFIVGDHGNAEELVNMQTKKVDKEHSIFPVPFIMVDKKFENRTIFPLKNNDLSLNSSVGILADVAPTILSHMNLPTAKEMTGNDLLSLIP